MRNAAIDIGYRAAFAWFMGFAPYAALTDRGSKPALFVAIEGAFGWAVMAGMAAVSLAIALDIIVNAVLNRRHDHNQSGWCWIRSRRDFLYLMGCMLACLAPYTLSRYDLIEASSVWWYSGLVVWGCHLAFLDISAKAWSGRVYPE